MFKDSMKIGVKLKGYGYIIRVLGIIAAVIGLVAQLVLLAQAHEEGAEFVLDVATPVMIVFCTLAGGWVVEGVGQIVINTGALTKALAPEQEQMSEGIVDEMTEETENKPAVQSVDVVVCRSCEQEEIIRKWNCPKCGAKVSKYPCHYCGYTE